MFDKGDIEEEVKNISNQYLLRFGNRVINMSHVIEIDSGFDKSGHTITFKYVDGSIFQESYSSQAMHSKLWSIIIHCLEAGLFNLELTSECDSKWADYERKEIDSNR
ncbi:hypothetical protein MIB92_05860 [Aestuariirhabdus sp. Z084]|uniref:hypothetical protein n=1 Tax=Aestuariirhabdus haliotis TaxID=2918751 RepID=UPI00201B433A|nr:hypothetical protein [Aestuariirhabdus haliotis]MCL6415169.1 hypothetical protein [Aestuariirhabdus haliotis]MCL6420044.1 hypothetical protein [Aestuariirhabdus haliotis]